MNKKMNEIIVPDCGIKSKDLKCLAELYVGPLTDDKANSIIDEWLGFTMIEKNGLRYMIPFSDFLVDKWMLKSNDPEHRDLAIRIRRMR